MGFWNSLDRAARAASGGMAAYGRLEIERKNPHLRTNRLLGEINGNLTSIDLSLRVATARVQRLNAGRNPTRDDVAAVENMVVDVAERVQSCRQAMGTAALPPNSNLDALLAMQEESVLALWEAVSALKGL